MELLLIRHAEAEPILEAVAEGADPALSPAGRDQADRLAAWYGCLDLTAIVASPLRRARETAEVLAAATGLPVVEDAALAEYDRRATTYVPVHLVARDDPEYRLMMEQGTYLAEAGREAPDEFRRRAVEAVEAVVADHPGGRVALVCHGGVINAYIGHVLGIPKLLWFLPANTSVSSIAAARTGQRSVVSLNETGHLLGRRVP